MLDFPLSEGSIFNPFHWDLPYTCVQLTFVLCSSLLWILGGVLHSVLHRWCRSGIIHVSWHIAWWCRGNMAMDRDLILSFASISLLVPHLLPAIDFAFVCSVTLSGYPCLLFVHLAALDSLCSHSLHVVFSSFRSHQPFRGIGEESHSPPPSVLGFRLLFCH